MNLDEGITYTVERGSQLHAATLSAVRNKTQVAMVVTDPMGSVSYEALSTVSQIARVWRGGVYKLDLFWARPVRVLTGEPVALDQELRDRLDEPAQ